LLRLAEAFGWDLLKQGLAKFMDIAFGKAELAGVDADVTADQLRGERPREVAQRRLRGLAPPPMTTILFVKRPMA
jgi:hypothetical protein